jgi:hypothetical protein
VFVDSRIEQAASQTQAVIPGYGDFRRANPKGNDNSVHAQTSTNRKDRNHRIRLGHSHYFLEGDVSATDVKPFPLSTMKFSKPTVSYLHAVIQGFLSFPEPEEPSPRVLPTFVVDVVHKIRAAAMAAE